LRRSQAGQGKKEIAADGETKKVYLDDVPDRAVIIGANLSAEEGRDIVRFLNRNKDVFAWSAKDLQGVDRDIIEHALEIDEKILRTMCGSRTGGWSLPCVMSD
jgi:hypothetical protein